MVVDTAGILEKIFRQSRKLISEQPETQTAHNMKENTTKIISRVTKWLAAFAGLLLLTNVAISQTIVYDDMTGQPPYTQLQVGAGPGIQFGDEIVLHNSLFHELYALASRTRP